MPIAVVIEDDKQILNSFTEFFSDYDIQVCNFETPPATSLLIEVKPSFVVIDCWFGSKLLGPEYAKKIRSILPQTPIILTSSDQSLESKVTISEMDYWLPKPMNWEKLAQIVEKNKF